MYQLERHGYSNVVGLEREYAIEVEDYDAKEELLDDIFSKSKVPNTELFALDIDLVKQLLSSFEGRQIYPETSKEEIFDDATKERAVKADWARIPDGIYYLSENKRNFGKVDARLKVEEGNFTVLKGAICAPTREGWVPAGRLSAPIVDNVLQADVPCNSPSSAGWIVLGHSNNGWFHWKDINGNPIDTYRIIK